MSTTNDDINQKRANRTAASFAINELQKASASCRKAFEALDNVDISPYLTEVGDSVEEAEQACDDAINEIRYTVSRL